MENQDWKIALNLLKVNARTAAYPYLEGVYMDAGEEVGVVATPAAVIYSEEFYIPELSGRIFNYLDFRLQAETQSFPNWKRSLPPPEVFKGEYTYFECECYSKNDTVLVKGKGYEGTFRKTYFTHLLKAEKFSLWARKDGEDAPVFVGQENYAVMPIRKRDK